MTSAQLSEMHNRGKVNASQALMFAPAFGSWKHQYASQASLSSGLQPSPRYSEESSFNFTNASTSPSRIPRPRPGYKRQHRRPSSGDGSQKQKSWQGKANSSKAGRYQQPAPLSPITPSVAMRGDSSPSLASISELTDEFGQLTCRQGKQLPNVLAIGWMPSHRFLLSPAFKKAKPNPSNWREMTTCHRSALNPSRSVYSYPQACKPAPCARLNFAGSPRPKQSGRQPRKATPKVYEFDPDLDITKGGYLDMSDPELTESEDSGKCSSKSSLSKDQTGWRPYKHALTFLE